MMQGTVTPYREATLSSLNGSSVRAVKSTLSGEGLLRKLTCTSGGVSPGNQFACPGLTRPWAEDKERASNRQHFRGSSNDSDH